MISPLRRLNLQGLHLVAQQVEDFLVVDLEETNHDPAVSLLLLLLEDHLQCAREDASFRPAKGRLVVVEIGVVFRTVADDGVGLPGSRLPAWLSQPY